jgi:hypothetical protein
MEEVALQCVTPYIGTACIGPAQYRPIYLTTIFLRLVEPESKNFLKISKIRILEFRVSEPIACKSILACPRFILRLY